MKIYRLRAECLKDIVGAVTELVKATKGEMSYTVHSTSLKGLPGLMPDCILYFECSLSIEDVRTALKKVEDGHVMVETVNLLSLYTGERCNHELL